MIERYFRSGTEQIRFNAEHQAAAIEVRAVDLNERGARYAVAGGAPSELPEHLWKLVRTDAFKQWYGDWEHAPVERFQTARGSVYSYDDNGHTTRYKTRTGEQSDRQDITVFADLTLDEEQDFLAAYRQENSARHGGEGVKVYIIEKLDDGTGRVVRTREEVANPNRLVLAVMNVHQNDRFTAGQAVQAKRVSLQPAEGLIVFDTRHFKEDGVTKTERHLGNKVTKITYAISDTSQLLKNGEPLLLRDPRSSDENDYCFVRTVNPMIMDRAMYAQRLAQFGLGADKPGRVKEALHQEGYDGLIIDGQPAPIFDDEQIMRVQKTT